MKAIRITRTGGPEVLTLADVEVGQPGPGQVRVRHKSVGVNYIDVYYRTGAYPAELPFVPGNEGSGVVVSVGEGVSEFREGDRVAYAGSLGGYAEERLIEAKFLVKLADAVDDDTAAAMMLKGLTAQYLLKRTYRAKPGDTILNHAAAGGVGLIVTQWAKHIGCTVIGTVSSEEKAELARQSGCDHVILYSKENFAERVRDITGGALCEVVYDGVGRATFPMSLDCLKPFGTFVSFGSASGPIEAFDIGLLAKKGSLFATRPTLFTHIAKREDLDAMAADLFEVVGSGAVKIPVHSRVPLAEAAEAHRALEGRQTTGATVLVP